MQNVSFSSIHGTLLFYQQPEMLTIFFFELGHCCGLCIQSTLLLGWVKNFAIFWQFEIQLNSSGWCCKGDILQWTMRCRFRLILSKCNPQDLSLYLESMVFGLPDLAWLPTFLQSKQNFLKYLVTLLWSTAPWPFIPEIFWLPL